MHSFILIYFQVMISLNDAFKNLLSIYNYTEIVQIVRKV